MHGPTGRGILVVRSPRSWIAPHRVTFRDHAKFYGRSSAGKYPLDTTELRAAFSQSEGLVQTIRRFRQERVAIVEADDGPVPLRQGAKLIFHIVPLSAYATPTAINLDDRGYMIRPVMRTSGFSTRFTLEGLASYSGRDDLVETMYSYALLFRTGIIEAVSVIGHADTHGLFVAPVTVEWDLLQVFKSYCETLARYAVEPPYYIFLSLTGVRDHRLYTGGPFFTPNLRHDILLLPEITVDDLTQSSEKILRPLFDLFWNAFGFPKSSSFDQSGAYIGERY